jgi:hypothetical protein
VGVFGRIDKPAGPSGSEDFNDTGHTDEIEGNDWLTDVYRRPLSLTHTNALLLASRLRHDCMISSCAIFRRPCGLPWLRVEAWWREPCL